jgi:hypothetical protein
MIHRYPVRIKLDPNTNVQTEAFIPDLDNARIDLTNTDIQREITELGGLARFLELYIDDLLEIKDENDEDIKEPRPLSFYDRAKRDIYLFSSLERINPKKIAGNAICLVGTGSDRNAYFVEDKKLVVNDNTPLFTPLSLRESDIQVLDRLEIDSKHPVTITRRNGQVIEPIMKQACAKANRKQADASEQWTDVPITHVSRNRCHCCENFLPKITTTSLYLEWTAMIPMAAGTLKITEKKLIPGISNDTANYGTMLSATINSLMMLYIIRSSPGSENQDGLGRSIDNLFHSAKRKLFCKKSTNNAAAVPYDSKDIIGWILKALLTLFTLHFIVTSGAVDFEQNLLVTETIEDPDAFLPATVVSIISQIAFIANQITDPLVYLGYWLHAWRNINHYMHQSRKVTSHMQIEEVTNTETNEGVIPDLEKGNTRNVNNAELHASLLEGIAPSERSTHSPRQFSAARPTRAANTLTREDEKSFCATM